MAKVVNEVRHEGVAGAIHLIQFLISNFQFPMEGEDSELMIV